MNMAFYTYGSHQMGMGHIYRSLALVRAFQKKCEAVSASFLSLNYNDGILKIKEFGYPVIQIPPNLSEQQEIKYCADALQTLHPDVFVADALQVSPSRMALFRDCSKYLLSMDDTGDGRFLANLVVNVLFQAPVQDNNRRELGGLEYLILREEFCTPDRPEVVVNPVVRRILVTQGGSDTYGVTVKIARALSKVDASIEIILLLGPAFQHENELEAALKESTRPFKVERDVRDIAGLFSQCDLAVSGAGNTLFELAAIGVPCIVLTQEYKEIETASRVSDYGFIRNLGLSENLTEEAIYHSVLELIKDYSLRDRMSRASRETVDGLGAERVADIIMKEGRFN